jgi:hypothetical protein
LHVYLLTDICTAVHADGCKIWCSKGNTWYICESTDSRTTFSLISRYCQWTKSGMHSFWRFFCATRFCPAQWLSVHSKHT